MGISQDKIVSWLRLMRVSGLGPVNSARLLDTFSGAGAIFEAGKNDLGRVEGIGEVLARSILDPAHLDTAKKDYQTCMERGLKVIPMDDPSYPEPLTRIPDPPVVLFMRGNYTADDEDAVAIVGSRNPDPYGESMATLLAAGLARYKITLVSGMARGVDGIAHRAALKAGGRTIAVLGTGADVVYPKEHDQLFEQIIECGAVISEFPPGTPPEATNFPRRNRIISGLSRGVVMVQAMSERSGALITVRHALEHGREVWAVPGNAGSRTGRAANNLIKQGARLVETPEDIVIDIRPLGTVALEGQIKEEKSESRAPALPDLQARLYALVPAPAEGSIDIDALSRQAGLLAGEVAGAMLELELSGLVKPLPGKKYVRMTEG